jgi:hypothetical protein
MSTRRAVALGVAAVTLLLIAAWACLTAEGYRRARNEERFQDECAAAIRAAEAPDNGASFDRYCWPLFGVYGDTMPIDNECTLAAQHALDCYPDEHGTPACFDRSVVVCRALFPRW